MTYRIFTTLAFLLISTALHAQQDAPAGETEVTAQPGSVAFCLGHCTQEKCEASKDHFQDCLDHCSRFKGLMHGCAAGGADKGYKNSRVKADAKYRPCPAIIESIKPLSDVTPGGASPAPGDSEAIDTSAPDAGAPDAADESASADQVNLSADGAAAPDDAATAEPLPDDSASPEDGQALGGDDQPTDGLGA